VILFYFPGGESKINYYSERKKKQEKTRKIKYQEFLISAILLFIFEGGRVGFSGDLMLKKE